MQGFICFVIVFAMSSAIDVSVYNSTDSYHDPTVVPKPVSCFSFWYHLNDPLNMRLYVRNEPPGVTAITVIYQTRLETVEWSKNVAKETGEKYYWFRRVLYYPEVKISLKLYKSNGLSYITVAGGMVVMTSRDKMTEEIYTYNDICLNYFEPCVLLVDLKHGLQDPPLATGTTTSTTTENTAETINPNNTVTSNNNSSSDLEISTNKTSAIDTKNAEQPQNLLLYVMIPSVIGTSAVILVTYLLWKKKYCHRNSRRTEGIELNTVPHEPFYLNMLFRRECAEEIAEIDQHHYEEINPRISKGG